MKSKPVKPQTHYANTHQENEVSQKLSETIASLKKD